MGKRGGKRRVYTSGKGVFPPVSCSFHFNLLFRAELDQLFLLRQAWVSLVGWSLFSVQVSGGWSSPRTRWPRYWARTSPRPCKSSAQQIPCKNEPRHEILAPLPEGPMCPGQSQHLPKLGISPEESRDGQEAYLCREQ